MEPDAAATAQGARTCLVGMHGAAASLQCAIQAACRPSQLRVGDYLTSSDLCRFEAMGLTDGDRTQVEGHPHPGLNISLCRMVVLNGFDFCGDSARLDDDGLIHFEGGAGKSARDNGAQAVDGECPIDGEPGFGLIPMGCVSA